MSDTVGTSRESVSSERRSSSSSSSSISGGGKRAISSSGPVGGASTGAPAAPIAATSSNYHRDRSKYNVATGTGFTPAPKDGNADQSQASSNSIGSDKARKASPGTSPGPSAGMASGSGSSSGIKGTLAEIHGAGESVRGTVGAAIDRAFNDQEGVAKNQAIAREGEWEVKTGQFSKSTKEREGPGQGR